MAYRTEAVRHVRSMRGKSRAHLFECSDGFYYVVKLLSDRQHHRALINEWTASSLLRALDISTPEIALVTMSPDCLSTRLDWNPCGSQLGYHFGSRFPGDPNNTATYDFVPAKLSHRIINPLDFIGAFVFDTWSSKADRRQSVFVRSQGGKRPSIDPVGTGSKFLALMVDNGCAFGGYEWRFDSYPHLTFCSDANAYKSVRSMDDLHPWVDRIIGLPEAIVDRSIAAIPPEWLADDTNAVKDMFGRFWDRRLHLGTILDKVVHSLRS